MTTNPWKGLMMSNVTSEERFWSRVAIAGPDECWDWTAGLRNHGYGRFCLRGRNHAASRVAWEFAFGHPGDLLVCHACDRPICCNPAHLFLGTSGDNLRDARDKGRLHAGRAASALKVRGESHGRAKLTESLVAQIRLRVSAGETAKAMAQEFGVSRSLTGQIVRREIWKHVA